MAGRGEGEPRMVDFGLDPPIELGAGPGDGDAPRANGFARLWAPMPMPFDDISTYAGRLQLAVSVRDVGRIWIRSRGTGSSPIDGGACEMPCTFHLETLCAKKKRVHLVSCKRQIEMLENYLCDDFFECVLIPPRLTIVQVEAPRSWSKMAMEGTTETRDGL